VTNPLLDILAADRVAAVTCNSAEMAEVVLQAAEERERPAVRLVSEHALLLSSGSRLVAALVAMTAASRFPAVVQVDHMHVLETVESALAAGPQAIKADGSAGFRGQRSLHLAGRGPRAKARGGRGSRARRASRRRRRLRISMQASAASATDPREVREFLARTGVDCLAVAIGNLHGNYVAPANLDWELLRSITRLVDLPLALHGASGLDRVDVIAALHLGIRKINFNTEFRTAWFGAMSGRIRERERGASQLELLDEVRR
jgi:tagatose 1,6-diphosphate aldolase GatY/KbaY